MCELFGYEMGEGVHIARKRENGRFLKKAPQKLLIGRHEVSSVAIIKAPSGRGLSRRDWGRTRHIKVGSPPQADGCRPDVDYSRMPSAEIQIVRDAFSFRHFVPPSSHRRKIRKYAKYAYF